MHVARWSEARDALMETPQSLPEYLTPDVDAARTVIDGALSDERSWLDPIEIRALFAAYAIPVVSSVLANDADDAAKSASQFLDAGQTVVVKILSRDIQHKSDIGGVRLNLTTSHAVRTAAAEILARAGAARPGARIAGVNV
jgi:acetyltransferase